MFENDERYKILECNGLIEEYFEKVPNTNCVNVFVKYLGCVKLFRRTIDTLEASKCLKDMRENSKYYNVDLIESF